MCPIGGELTDELYFDIEMSIAVGVAAQIRPRKSVPETETVSPESRDTTLVSQSSDGRMEGN